MATYLNLQNKALHQGMYLAYVVVPYMSHGDIFTTNGHIMVLGQIDEVKPLKSQEDHRGDVAIELNDPAWGTLLHPLADIEGGVTPVDDETVRANGLTYQSIYVQYVMARWKVADWKRAGTKLVAYDAGENIIAIIAPIERISHD